MGANIKTKKFAASTITMITMRTVSSQPKPTESATSPMPQTDDGTGIAAAGQIVAGLLIASAADDGERAVTKNRSGEEANTSLAEDRSGEEAKSTSGPRRRRKRFGFRFRVSSGTAFSSFRLGVASSDENAGTIIPNGA